jgi:hypothetical protein
MAMARSRKRIPTGAPWVIVILVVIVAVLVITLFLR